MDFENFCKIQVLDVHLKWSLLLCIYMFVCAWKILILALPGPDKRKLFDKLQNNFALFIQSMFAPIKGVWLPTSFIKFEKSHIFAVSAIVFSARQQNWFERNLSLGKLDSFMDF